MKFFHKKEVYEYVLNFLSPAKRSFVYQLLPGGLSRLIYKKLFLASVRGNFGKKDSEAQNGAFIPEVIWASLAHLGLSPGS